ncbi:unnamed protein product [Umbelopsis sp. WA50703]
MAYGKKSQDHVGSVVPSHKLVAKRLICSSYRYPLPIMLEVDEDRKVKAELDGMYAFLGDILENNAVVLQYKEGGNDDRGQDAVLNDYIRQLQSCVHMFDQDYVMKETIQAILSSSSQLSSLQHLNGFYSVWTAEPYIDDDLLKGC